MASGIVVIGERGTWMLEKSLDSRRSRNMRSEPNDCDETGIREEARRVWSDLGIHMYMYSISVLQYLVPARMCEGSSDLESAEALAF